LSEVEKLIPEIDLTRYLKAIVPKAYNIEPNLTVQVNDINYYRNLSTILKETPRETIHNYVANRIIKRYSSHVHKNFSMPLTRVDNFNSGLKPDNVPPRWRTCINAVDNHLEFMYGGLYVDQAFSAKDKTLGDKITKELRDEFQTRLKGLDWLSEDVKPTGLKKVDTMIQKIGYQANHPDISNSREVFDFYKPRINVAPNATWFQLREMFGDAENKINWERFLKPVDTLLWSTNAPTVNAFYSPSMNSITFPAGIMRSPIFSALLPDYVSYGSFGAVAGHEITHSFDDNGSKYDDKRKYRNWWDEETKTNFRRRTQCFVDQYANFTVEGLKPGERIHVDGKLTLSENIADAGGINAAYAAWERNSKHNPRLPGLERYTTEQMFFVSFGNLWCSKMRKERMINSVFSDAHSPASTRIIGTTANTAAFRKAFNCPVKEPTCSLW
jgi:endothelin-converting enzyme